MKRKNGFSIVEALIVVFIFTTSIFFIWKIYVSYIKISLSNLLDMEATSLAEEGIEVLRFWRDNSWSTNINSLSTTTAYSLNWNGLVWSATTTYKFIDNKFDRRVYLSDVYRNTSQNISTSGTFDPNVKKIKVVVSWYKETGTTTTEIISYITNIFNN